MAPLCNFYLNHFQLFPTCCRQNLASYLDCSYYLSLLYQTQLISFLFFWPCLRHVEAPRPGIKPILQQWPPWLQGQPWILNLLCHSGKFFNRWFSLQCLLMTVILHLVYWLIRFLLLFSTLGLPCGIWYSGARDEIQSAVATYSEGGGMRGVPLFHPLLLPLESILHPTARRIKTLWGHPFWVWVPPMALPNTPIPNSLHSAWPLPTSPPSWPAPFSLLTQLQPYSSS